jgi:hypothetical protein
MAASAESHPVREVTEARSGAGSNGVMTRRMVMTPVLLYPSVGMTQPPAV